MCLIQLSAVYKSSNQVGRREKNIMAARATSRLTYTQVIWTGRRKTGGKEKHKALPHLLHREIGA